MYNNLRAVIPVRFLCLIGHLTVTIALLWASEQSAINCLRHNNNHNQDYMVSTYTSMHNQLVIGLSIMLGMIAFEFLTYLSGITMFHSRSSLLSICCHSSGCILLTHFVINHWQCGWFWWCFAFCSVLPTFVDFCIVCNVCVKRKW